MTFVRTSILRRVGILTASLTAAAALVPGAAFAATSLTSACTSGTHYPTVTIVVR
jgi:hypothetical protein